MGPLHIMHNREKAFSELKKEFKRIGQDNIEDEKLLEPVSIDGKVVRVNLRPYKKEINDIELLFKAMVESAKNFIPDSEKLTNIWGEFKGFVQKDELPFNYKEVLAFENDLQSKEDFEISHSEIYRSKENPFYRVILKRNNIRGQAGICNLDMK